MLAMLWSRSCRSCRISLNLRCGLHTADEVRAIEAVWGEGDDSDEHEADGDGDATHVQ